MPRRAYFLALALILCVSALRHADEEEGEGQARKGPPPPPPQFPTDGSRWTPKDPDGKGSQKCCCKIGGCERDAEGQIIPSKSGAMRVEKKRSSGGKMFGKEVFKITCCKYKEVKGASCSDEWFTPYVVDGPPGDCEPGDGPPGDTPEQVDPTMDANSFPTDGSRWTPKDADESAAS